MIDITGDGDGSALFWRVLPERGRF